MSGRTKEEGGVARTLISCRVFSGGNVAASSVFKGSVITAAACSFLDPNLRGCVCVCVCVCV